MVGSVKIALLLCLLYSAHGFNRPSSLAARCRSRNFNSQRWGFNYKGGENPFTRTVAPEFPKSSAVSELPDSFDDAVSRAVKATLTVFASGSQRVRIDFDTSIGDVTYTSLKNTLPMMKEFSKSMSAAMDLSYATKFTLPKKKLSEDPDLAAAEAAEEVEATKVPAEPLVIDRTMRIFFPDMGAAALVRRDWKLGTDVCEVPPCVFTANIQNDPVEPTDKLVVLLCPLSSEADFVKRVMEMCDINNVPIVMINQDLINMDQGYGVRARNLRDAVLNAFTTSYKLKTMEFGAVVREWPNGYSVWNEDATEADGYRVLETYARDPTREMTNDLYDEANPDPEEQNKKPNPAKGVIKEVFGFFQGLSRL